MLHPLVAVVNQNRSDWDMDGAGCGVGMAPQPISSQVGHLGHGGQTSIISIPSPVLTGTFSGFLPPMIFPTVSRASGLALKTW